MTEQCCYCQKLNNKVFTAYIVYRLDFLENITKRKYQLILMLKD